MVWIMQSFRNRYTCIKENVPENHLTWSQGLPYIKAPWGLAYHRSWPESIPYKFEAVSEETCSLLPTTFGPSKEVWGNINNDNSLTNGRHSLPSDTVHSRVTMFIFKKTNTHTRVATSGSASRLIEAGATDVPDPFDHIVVRVVQFRLVHFQVTDLVEPTNNTRFLFLLHFKGSYAICTSCQPNRQFIFSHNKINLS